LKRLQRDPEVSSFVARHVGKAPTMPQNQEVDQNQAVSIGRQSRGEIYGAPVQ